MSRLRDVFWWPNPLTYKGGVRAWVRDCVSMYWRDFRKWLRVTRCEWFTGHDFRPYTPPPDGWYWLSARNSHQCTRCGRFE